MCYRTEANLPKRQGHIALGLERVISDEDEDAEDEGEDQTSHFLYETEEDVIIDELDKQYLEHLEQAAAESADPLEGDEAPATGKTRLTGQNQYDQLKQEDEILSGGDHK